MTHPIKSLLRRRQSGYLAQITTRDAVTVLERVRHFARAYGIDDRTATALARGYLAQH